MGTNALRLAVGLVLLVIAVFPITTVLTIGNLPESTTIEFPVAGKPQIIQGDVSMQNPGVVVSVSTGDIIERAGKSQNTLHVIWNKNGLVRYLLSEQGILFSAEEWFGSPRWGSITVATETKETELRGHSLVFFPKRVGGVVWSMVLVGMVLALAGSYLIGRALIVAMKPRNKPLAQTA
ncbi:MAG: hypothetical protein V1696_00620 [Candidatus Jorgensenbacteria bacterium]